MTERTIPQQWDQLNMYTFPPFVVICRVDVFWSRDVPGGFMLTPADISKPAVSAHDQAKRNSLSGEHACAASCMTVPPQLRHIPPSQVEGIQQVLQEGFSQGTVQTFCV